ncbi:hypothetical protein [Malikia granosa]|uniref:hypothetical protein n=1 Tax=Malikia granosa TaxID=263067 RepID=UPI0011B06FB2|nr:hypothetical protein [Malikia granosa]
MKVLPYSIWLGLLLTVNASGVLAAEAEQAEAIPTQLNLNLPRQTGNAVTHQPAKLPETLRSSNLQRLPYGSGYEARQGDWRDTGHRSPIVGGRGAGRGR